MIRHRRMGAKRVDGGWQFSLPFGSCFCVTKFILPYFSFDFEVTKLITQSLDFYP